MNCGNITSLYRRKSKGPGQSQMTVNEKHGIASTVMPASCGKCRACILDKIESWADRILQEASAHQFNSFATLTYRPENLDPDGNLVKQHHQQFLKNLRKLYLQNQIRYYMAGEYGSRNQRPHYHFILFGLEHDDLKQHTIRDGRTVYTSAKIARAWRHGLHEITTFKHQDARYVAKYCAKTYAQSLKDNPTLVPEYTAYSKHPALGYSWYRQNREKIFSLDNTPFYFHANKNPYRPHRYYRACYEKEFPEQFKAWQKHRLLLWQQANPADHLIKKTADSVALHAGTVAYQLHQHLWNPSCPVPVQ